MRVLSPEKIAHAKLDLHEQYFIELWYSMTHMQSMDSYRVRCMNSRTVIRELYEEIKIGIIKDAELLNLCCETKEFINSDPVIFENFTIFLNKINPFLSHPPFLHSNEKERKENKERGNNKLSDFKFLVGDFSCQLEREYFEKIIAYLPKTIKPDKTSELKIVVDALLSELIDKGWPLETLFGWYNHFLAPKEKAYSFTENLEFMLKVFASKPKDHQVILKLHGGKSLNKIQNYGDFSFVDHVDIATDNNLKKKFQRKLGVVFAQTTIDDVDTLSAAIRVREKFEQVIDLLRFNLEPDKLRIDARCYVKRLNDQKEEFPLVNSSVPNPNEKDGHDDFIIFTQDLDRVSNKQCIDENSRRQLQAAFRQYRFGRDSENYNDKFLNWWMGLEALSRVGNGREIGATVTCNVSRAMAVPYLHRLVRDFATTLKYCRITWPEQLVEISECALLDDLTVNQLVTILQSDKQQILWDQCQKFPMVCCRGIEIGDFLSSPHKTSIRLQGHLRHLEWHLERLYRIRCCIVHGAPVRFRLGLLAANLEYYLKQVILQVLKTFNNNDHIGGLADFFERAAFAYDRTLKELDEKTAGLEQVRSAVFLDFVL